MRSRCATSPGFPWNIAKPCSTSSRGRLQAARQGAKPVYDALRYLHHLCAEVNRGGFHPNLGLKVQGARERRRRDAERARGEAAAHKRPARALRPPNESPLAEMKKKLGLPPAPRRKSH